MIDIHDGASVRNLERIQEDGPGARQGVLGKGGTLTLIVAALGCVLFAGLALGARRTTTAPTKKVDPLSELAAKPGSSTVMPGEVTFPGILSDRTNPATAMAAAGAGSVGPLPALQPPPALDKLPVVPLPARHALTQPFVIAKPKDKLSMLADPASDPAGAGGPMAASGSEGGWQVQVSSFRTSTEADAFVKQLRARGHKAHVQQANIPSRGTWYRVKVGPFSNQLEATKYRTAFEAKEKIPGFVVKSGVDPH